MLASEELIAKTKYYEKRIGDSVLLAKCYELCGREGDAKRVATQVTRTELQILSEISVKLKDISMFAEQILRVIYVFHLSGNKTQANFYFNTFVKKAKEIKFLGKELEFDVCFRICIAQIILGDHFTSIKEFLTNESFLIRLISSWVEKDVIELETCYLDLEKEIENAENESGLVPWSDTWYYILSNRLEKFLE